MKRRRGRRWTLRFCNCWTVNRAVLVAEGQKNGQKKLLKFLIFSVVVEGNKAESVLSGVQRDYRRQVFCTFPFCRLCFGLVRVCRR